MNWNGFMPCWAARKNKRKQLTLSCFFRRDLSVWQKDTTKRAAISLLDLFSCLQRSFSQAMPAITNIWRTGLSGQTRLFHICLSIRQAPFYFYVPSIAFFRPVIETVKPESNGLSSNDKGRGNAILLTRFLNGLILLRAI